MQGGCERSVKDFSTVLLMRLLPKCQPWFAGPPRQWVSSRAPPDQEEAPHIHVLLCSSVLGFNPLNTF